MNASKENADKAIAALGNLSKRAQDSPDGKLIAEFLNVAKRKLPKEASFAKAKAGRGTKAAAKK